MTVILARKKPVVVEVMQFKMTLSTYLKCRKFVGDSWIHYYDMPNRLPAISTLEGVMEISDNDFIIKGVDGEFYPCKPEIFEKTYDLVEETPKRYVFNPTPEGMDKANELGDKINAEVVRLIEKYS